MRKIYWNIRHWVWEYKEHMLVKHIMRHAKDNDIIYIHPNGESIATYAVVKRIGDNWENSINYDNLDIYNHAHLEGK